jgi:hypothetical protein
MSSAITALAIQFGCGLQSTKYASAIAPWLPRTSSRSSQEL